jgi:predicted extracellular nuclease
MTIRILKVFILVFLLLNVDCVFAIEPEVTQAKYDPKRNITVAFYNVENLFDTVNQQGERDGEFTPSGKNKWTQERYTKKLTDISKVLSSVNKNELPEIIGLCEIENRKVLDDLVKTYLLKKGNYAIAHFESPDYRGIDCALLYRPDEFKVKSASPVHISFPDDAEYTTRDILLVKGETRNREEFCIFVNHWPSRTSGLEQSEPKRLAAARILKSKIDSVLRVTPAMNIIVMGDMNDEPSNQSLNMVLGAKNPGVAGTGLLNLMYPLHLEKKGTYNYRGSWNMLDNIIVSAGLLDNRGLKCNQRKGFVFNEKWMENFDEKGVMYPNRTYGGPNYYGGVSDHFPVYILLTN